MSNFTDSINKKQARSAFRALNRVSDKINAEGHVFVSDDLSFYLGFVGNAGKEIATQTIASLIPGKHSKGFDVKTQAVDIIQAYESVKSRTRSQVNTLLEDAMIELQHRLYR